MSHRAQARNVLTDTSYSSLFEEFKTRFYNLEGWDPKTGYPTGNTLESLGLGYVADELEENNKLGEEQI